MGYVLGGYHVGEWAVFLGGYHVGEWAVFWEGIMLVSGLCSGRVSCW